ncbi:MAG: tetratricopeptide repeat protein [Deltaproteobacteria bacterium]|nr:tetratricopeptide repeat protein [Deltaproteobacteria bacterium]
MRCLVLSLVAAQLLLVACDPFSTSNSTVDEGVEHYAAGRYDESVQSFEQARDEIPERSELFYDLGTAQIAREKYADAETSLVRALEIAGDELRPLVWANLGHARLKNALATSDETQRRELLTKSVDALGKAVLLRSDLESARHDLELALLHLYPPCEKRDDKLEPNDSVAKATDASTLGEEPLMLCPGNHDWFTWKTEAGDRVDITLEAVGDAPAGPPEASLFDAAGAVVAATGAASGNGAPDGSEAGPALSGPRRIRHEALAGGSFSLDVFEKDDEEHPYRIRAKILPACSRLQDSYEPNDSRDQASPIDLHNLGQQPHATLREPPAGNPPGQVVQAAGGGNPRGQAPTATAQQPPGIPIRICPGDEDWFRFPLARHESVLLQLIYQPLEGDLALEILDAAGNVAATARQAEPPQQASPAAPGEEKPKALAATMLDVPADGEWFLRIRGVSDRAEAQGLIVAVVRPPCPEGDDETEENDTRETATPLASLSASAQQGMPQVPGGSGSAPVPGAPGAAAPGGASGAEPPPLQVEKLLRRCPGDDDWFSLDLKKGQSVEASISFEHAKGDLKLELYEDDDDKPLVESDKSSDQQNGEGLRFGAEEDTHYLLRVTGPAGATNFYMVKVAPPSPDQDKKDQDKKDQEKKDQDKKEQEKKDQDKKEQEPRKKPIEQVMDQMDQQKQKNLEAERALRNLPNARVPGGKPW